MTVGAMLAPSLLSACAETGVTDPFALPSGYYPPAKTGLRGSHDGSWESMHGVVAGDTVQHGAPEETVDLIIIGAGMSGLAAAWYYRDAKHDARILILDNHDDFGGHAKRNEFDVNGTFRIGYGGTEAIDTPSGYDLEAMRLLRGIGVDVDRFYDYFDQDFWDREDLSKSILFDGETFGKTKLVPGYGSRSWEDFAADMPVSEMAKAEFIRLQTSTEDYLPDLTFDEKYALLRKTSYEDFLRNHARAPEEVINIYKRWGMSFWCVGIDEIPATLIQNYDGGMPGVTHTLPRTGSRNDDPYIFHFPDGNASIARLMVRNLIPDAMPGSTMEDVVMAKANYTALDRADQPIRLRLNSTAVKMNNVRDGVVVTYSRHGQRHTVRAGHAVMAGYNAVLPYLCDELPDAQVAALGSLPKVPLVYTKVAVPDWRRFKDIGTDFVYFTDGFYKQVEFAYPVSIGGYEAVSTPDDPLVLHMCHVPWVPDVQGPDQWRVGRSRILSTPFETFEHHVKRQLSQALAGHDFDPERDISAITVNRWPHGYAYSPDLIWEPDYATDADKPWVIGRQAVGRIHVANSDAGAKPDTGVAMAQAYRAVTEILS
ncbi:NAD(P)-binding protein [Algimonas porphyrae]|nr:NAD(P)/FAD-dependent oxidoreductase [Algimonas porphyrae]